MLLRGVRGTTLSMLTIPIPPRVVTSPQFPRRFLQFKLNRLPKGNVDPGKLEAVLQEYGDKIPFIIVTITNNTAGGQPVSMQNLREVRALADKYGKRVVYDSARFVENAYFIKTREEGYADKSIKEIVKEMFSLADGMTMSSKKDGLVNMGGFIATRHEDWYEGAKKYCIPFEGYLTYGGMNGRDMAALAVGLEENTEFDNIETRIRQVQYLAARLDEFGIPYQRPVGGHALFIDADRVLSHVPWNRPWQWCRFHRWCSIRRPLRGRGICCFRQWRRRGR